MNWFDGEDEFEEYRDKLGALVLLKGPDNQSSGNETYSDKLKTYHNVGSLWAKTLVPEFDHSNTGFNSFCQDKGITFKNYEKYDAVAVKERFYLLMELIKLIWE